MTKDISALFLHYASAAVVLTSILGLSFFKKRKAAISILSRLGVFLAVSALVFIGIEIWSIYQTMETGGLFEKLALRKSLKGSHAWMTYARLGGALSAQGLWIPMIRQRLPACLAIGILSDTAFWVSLEWS